MTYREALNLALSEEMRRDGRVFVIGGGLGSSDADEGTLRLLDEFDPRRVVHTHIAESGLPASASARRWSACAPSSS